ncbi:glycosyltransferase [Arthrobacter sp. Edens01]|uniref:glycosyltransferase n=1 Tax=Arthrobacter sp. Edens01 TaxID=1732020 RepID=UPI00128F9D59|nr:glycosyltransferase family 2 protein [Arthrobacter sp. Edens01]
MKGQLDRQGGPGPAVTYILPLRRGRGGELADLPGYLGMVSSWEGVAVLVVDGSPPEVFAEHARLLPPGIGHLRPGYACLNGKVSGVLTGLDLARTELCVIADDDVRYTEDSFTELLRHLRTADLVRPQNYFTQLPWHARWDTARTLLNRALGADYPGTLGVRRSILRASGGYDGDVLFENLELIRTVRAAGGTELRVQDLFVARKPCSARHFWTQRVRQAYDDFAQPVRLATELLLLPVLAAGSLRRRGFPLAMAGLAVGLAEIGRRRSRGREVFAPSSALWAPAWVLERSVAVWAALALRFAGGVPYAGRRLRTAAHSERFLRRRLNDRRNELSLAGAFRPAPQTVSTHTEPLRSLPQ